MLSRGQSKHLGMVAEILESHMFLPLQILHHVCYTHTTCVIVKPTCSGQKTVGYKTF